MVFSFFCAPKQVVFQTSSVDEEEDKMVNCLDQQSTTTFDTLDTYGSHGTVEKNSNAQVSLLGSLLGSEDCNKVGKHSNPKELPMLAKDVDLETVPSDESVQDVEEFDLAMDAVKDNVHGPDMPEYVDADVSRGPNLDITSKTRPKMTDESSTPVGVNTINGNLDETSSKEEADAVFVKENACQEKGPETCMTEGGHSLHNEEADGAFVELAVCTGPEPTQERDTTDSPMNEEGTLPNVETTDDFPNECETVDTAKDADSPEGLADGKSVEQRIDMVRADDPKIETGSTDSNGAQATVVEVPDREETSLEPLSNVEEEESTPNVQVDFSEAKADTGPDKPPMEEEDASTKAKHVDHAGLALETRLADTVACDITKEEDSGIVFAPELGAFEEQLNKISLNDSTDSDGTAWDTTEEDDTRDLSTASERSVRFSEPLVTSSLEVPRINIDDLDELFYTATEISEFRQQKQKGGAPARPYNKKHCRKLVEDLDRLGMKSFVDGDYQKALGAFNHSLQVKTQIMTDCDAYSTSTTIHCIADVYSKKRKWIQAMDAYNAALEVIKKAYDTEDVRRSRNVLEQKLVSIRRLLGIQEGTTEEL